MKILSYLTIKLPAEIKEFGKPKLSKYINNSSIPIENGKK